MKIIVGLGNPGIEYQNTRHNIGFMVCDALIKTHNLQEAGIKYKSVTYTGLIGLEKVLVLKPQTYMNLSGDAVIAAKSFFKSNLEDVLIIYDDFDLPLDKIRLKPKGSAGTHNGMKDILIKCGKNEVPRLRVGIGPKPVEWATKDFVLSRFATVEAETLGQTINNASEAAERWVKHGIDEAMRACN